MIRTTASAISAALPQVTTRTGKVPVPMPLGNTEYPRAIAVNSPSGFAIELVFRDNAWWWRQQEGAYLGNGDRQLVWAIPFSTASTKRVVLLTVWMAGEFAKVVRQTENGLRQQEASRELAHCLQHVSRALRQATEPQIREDCERYLASLLEGVDVS